MDQLGGLMFSQRVLLALTQQGVSRDEAYLLVQRNAMMAWKEGNFLGKLQADRDITAALSANDLNNLFDMAHHTRHIDVIFNRVFGLSGEK